MGGWGEREGEGRGEKGEERKRSSTYYTLWSILSINVPVSHWGGGGGRVFVGGGGGRRGGGEEGRRGGGEEGRRGGGEEGRRGEGWGEIKGEESSTICTMVYSECNLIP